MYKVLPGPVDGDQLLYGLGLDERAGIFRAVGDDLVDSVEDGNHSVLLKVFGWPLLTTRQVAHQVPHGVTSYKVKYFFEVNQVKCLNSKVFFLINFLKVRCKKILIRSSIFLKIS